MGFSTGNDKQEVDELNPFEVDKDDFQRKMNEGKLFYDLPNQ